LAPESATAPSGEEGHNDEDLLAILLGDLDADGSSNLNEIGDNTDFLDPASGGDLDGDGIANGVDSDVDGDGIENADDDGH